MRRSGACRWIVLFAVGLALLAGCSAPTPRPVILKEQDAAPVVSPRSLAQLARLPDPKVVPVNPGRRGNPPVYTVLGKRYRVMDTARGYRKEGIASWYGTKFHGRLTSLGEPFDMYQLSAAHKHLPIPCFVRVTNLENNRQTIVRVNDRGPFHDDRIIDLSYAAAVKLGFHNRGVAKVRVEVVEAAAPVRSYLVQVGALSSLAAADGLQAQLRRLTGLKGVVIKTAVDGKYRVQLGPVNSGSALERLDALLQTGDFPHVRTIPQT